MKIKYAFHALILSVAFTSAASALDRVTIQGPVEVIRETPGGRVTGYWVQTPENIRYKVLLPSTESERLVTTITSTPKSVIQFDGTVTDSDGVKIVTASNWKTVTTTVTDSAGNVTRKEETVVVDR